MEYGSLYKSERVENLRSKIVILKSSLEILELNFWSTYENYYSKNLMPPFLYPKMTFDRLKKHINELLNLIKLTPLLSIGYLEAKFLSEIDERLDRVMESALKLQDILIQRTSGIEVFDNLNYHVNFQIEYSGLIKAFSAVDALAYELVKRTMGTNWIWKNKYVPVTVFGKQNFSIIHKLL